MSKRTRPDETYALYGNTSDAGSIPSRAGGSGPRYDEGGRLVLAASFGAAAQDKNAGCGGIGSPASSSNIARFEGDWLADVLRLWDCDAQDWAPERLTVLRFESADLVVDARSGETVTYWVGSLDDHARIVASSSQPGSSPCYAWLADPQAACIAGDQVIEASATASRVGFTFESGTVLAIPCD